jgi:hypothetical protein
MRLTTSRALPPILASLIAAALSSTTLRAQDWPANPGPVQLVAGLRERGWLAAELGPQVEAIAAVLVAEGGQWSRLQFNSAYDPEALNLYLVKLPAADSLPADLSRLRGTMLAFPRERIILADAGYLATVKAASDIYWASIRRKDHAVAAHEALAIATVEGPDAAERSRLGSDWRDGGNELFDGAVAFLIAHEMGHVVLGLDPALERHVSLPRGLTGRDRDRIWACTTMLGDVIAGRRQQEAEADAYAIGLLGRITTQTPPRLRFELGTLFLLNGELGKLVNVLIALNPNGPTLMARAGLGVNAELVRALSAQLSRQDGLIATIFPDSHPALVDRMLEIASAFVRNPTSLSYGNANAVDSQRTWRLLVQIQCHGIGSSQ